MDGLLKHVKLQEMALIPSIAFVPAVCLMGGVGNERQGKEG